MINHDNSCHEGIHDYKKEKDLLLSLSLDEELDSKDDMNHEIILNDHNNSPHHHL